MKRYCEMEHDVPFAHFAHLEPILCFYVPPPHWSKGPKNIYDAMISSKKSLWFLNSGRVSGRVKNK